VERWCSSPLRQTLGAKTMSSFRSTKLERQSRTKKIGSVRCERCGRWRGTWRCLCLMRLRCRFPEEAGGAGPKVVSTVQVKGGACGDRYLEIGKCAGKSWVAMVRISMLAASSFRFIDVRFLNTNGTRQDYSLGQDPGGQEKLRRLFSRN
jgi:ribosomal protein S14